MNKVSILCLLFLGFLPPAIIAQSDPSTYGQNSKTGNMISHREFHMYYEMYGSGEPLLLIHGNGGSIRDFTYQIPFFEKHFKLILADSRAQGRSVDPGDSLSYEMMADDLASLLDSLGLDSCHVIGWSDGGINGLMLAMRHPEKVKKLAITGANLSPDTTAVDPWVRKWALHINDSLATLPPSPEINHMRKLFRLLSYEPNIPIAALQSIQCPTLVIGGDHDVIRPAHTLQIAEGIPRSYLWILPNSGHSTPVFYRDQFNETILHFFQNPFRVIERFGRFQ